MSFEKIIRIPKDRIGALIGKSGRAKLKIEDSCSVRLEINSENGEIHETMLKSLNQKNVLFRPKLKILPMHKVLGLLGSKSLKILRS